MTLTIVDTLFLGFLYLVFLGLMVYLWIFLIGDIREIAKKTGRNVTMWTVISIVMSPFIGIVMLTCFETCEFFIRNVMKEPDNKINKNGEGA